LKAILSVLLILACVISASAYFIMQPVFFHSVTPSVLRVGILPDVGVDNLHQRYDPLLNYLSAETGLEYKLVHAENYAGLLRLFHDQDVDLAYFGGYTFVRAQAFFGARPLVMREIDTRFTSLFLVRGENSALQLADFKNKAFSFGSELSTSGHLMPRHFLQVEKQVVPEQFFSKVHYSGAHDKTAYLVRDGKVDLGVANAEIILAMIKDGRLKQGEIRTLWQTPPYPDYVWTVHDYLDEDVKTQLRNAFLKLDNNDKDHNKILSRLGARFFLPAGAGDFTRLKRVAESLGLLQQGSR
jgi:phosphonate transport system substrate-binding protein